MRIAAFGLLALTLAGGCAGEAYQQPQDACERVGPRFDLTRKGLDLLFVIDSSNSMTEEQAALAAELPRLFRILTSGDRNEDGDRSDAEDFHPLDDINVGVITADMGSGGHSVPSCARADFGDDGVLRTWGRTDLGCLASYPSILNFYSGGRRIADDFARDVACVAGVGTGGCGFEQPLEAILKALTPRRRVPWTAPDFVLVGTPGAPLGLERPFFRNSAPHGSSANDGFVREGSVLAIVPLTDEDDCSVLDPDLFSPIDPNYARTDLNLRCFEHADRALHPVDRFANGFIQLRGRPGLLVFAPIVGIPPDLAPAPGEQADYVALASPDPAVRDDRMEERIDPASPTRLYPSCEVAGVGPAFPPVRIVRVAEQLEAAGAAVTVQSICSASLRSAVDAILDPIADIFSVHCLSRPLLREAPGGAASCDVQAELAAGSRCEDLAPGAVLAPPEGSSVELCTIPQLVPTELDRAMSRPPAGRGWYVDDYSGPVQGRCADTSGQRIAFTIDPMLLVDIRLSCDVPSSSELGLGEACEHATDACAAAWDGFGVDLACDPVDARCAVRCDEDADCHDLLLYDHVCDTRALGEILPGRFGGAAEPYGFCIRAQCWID